MNFVAAEVSRDCELSVCYVHAHKDSQSRMCITNNKAGKQEEENQSVILCVCVCVCGGGGGGGGGGGVISNGSTVNYTVNKIR